MKRKVLAIWKGSGANGNGILTAQSGAFENIYTCGDLHVALIGLGNEPKQYQKLVTVDDLKRWKLGLVTLIELMKIEPSAFVAFGDLNNQSIFLDDFRHLSRFGEWNDNDEHKEIFVGLTNEGLGNT